MSFITDKQTLDDLNIPGKYRADSVFSLFNKTKTRGGERLLEELFRIPLTDAAAINQRVNTFRYFAEQQSAFPISSEKFSVMEEYLSSPGKANLMLTAISIGTKKLLRFTVRDEAYDQLQQQVAASIGVLHSLYHFLSALPVFDSANQWLQELLQAKKMLSADSLMQLINAKNNAPLPATTLIRYDHLLRTVYINDLEILLGVIYKLDVFMAVGAVTRNKGFHFARALPREKDCLFMENLRHPCIEKAVGNDVSLQQQHNVIFLTGANMAGKSTFMKSFSIAVYLAHMGFPVPAENMLFSVKDGLYTSINVPDNLALGYSHFYAEVLRVKKIAEQIASRLQLVIIFDELFKGTNVKDAYDATVAVTGAFATKRNCFFIISTHITEAGEALQQQFSNLQYVFFPSLLRGNKPVYTYKLEPGISNDKHGMVILRQEEVFELILSGNG